MHRREKRNLQLINDILNSVYKILSLFKDLHFFIQHIHHNNLISMVSNTNDDDDTLSRFHLIEPLSPIIIILYELISIIITDSYGIHEEITMFNNKETNYYIPILHMIQQKELKLLNKTRYFS